MTMANNVRDDDLGQHDCRPKTLVYTRDSHPTTRVDLIHLFSRHLSAWFEIKWLMSRGEHFTGDHRSAKKNAAGEAVTTYRPGFLSIFALLPELKKIFKKQYELVIVRDAFITATLVFIVAKYKRIPSAYWMSYPMEIGYLHRGIRDLKQWRLAGGVARLTIGGIGYFLLNCVALRLCDHIFVQSNAMRTMVENRIGQRQNISAVPMGVDFEILNRITDDIKLSEALENKFLIVYTGTIDESRRMEVPSKAIAKFCKDNINVRFIIIGKSNESQKLRISKEFLACRTESQLVFMDFLPFEDMLSLLRQCDICLAPYPSDTQLLATSSPTKLVEYVALGKVTVANSHPDQSVIASHFPSLVFLCDFNSDSFLSAVTDAHEFLLKQARNEGTVNLGAEGLQWLKMDRDYQAIARKVANQLNALMAVN